ncbi:Alanine--tRNA [Hortaea werneckii]|nr:Alanine--tRNA [Hortaea werneckii]
MPSGSSSANLPRYSRAPVISWILLNRGVNTSTGIDVLVRQRLQSAVRLTVVLDEDVVPDLEHIRVILVDEICSIAIADAVVVNFRARTTGTLVAHFPEVVLHVTGEDVIFGNANTFPELLGLEIGLQTCIGFTFEVSDIQSVRLQAEDFRQEFPGIGNGFFLEVISKRPVTQHLEEGVMIGVFADIVEVIVLATSTDTLLKIDLYWFMPALVKRSVGSSITAISRSAI